jgi:hypothetical protein
VGVLGAVDGAAEDGTGFSRRPLRDARSSEPRVLALGVTLGVTLGEPTALIAVDVVSVAGPRVMAPAAAATTTPATRRADIRGTILADRCMRCAFGAMEPFRLSRDRSASACSPDKIQTFRRRQVRTDGTEHASVFVKSISLLCPDSGVIFGGPNTGSSGILVPVRRTVTIDRSQLITLLGYVADPAHVACQAELTAGASFRLHDGTVSRESVLRTYATRIPAAGTHEALRRLAMCGYPHLRLGAVSGAQRFVLFMDPDAQQVVACLGVPSRAG